MPTNPSLLIVPYRYKAAKLYSQLPESGAGDFTVTRSTTATRTNASGLLESVASGVPRLDYQGGGCPALLVEPAATNLLLRSEQFDDAYWTKTNGTITETNQIAPDGTATAETFVANASFPRIERLISFADNTNYVMSVYLKNTSANFRILAVDKSGNSCQAIFNPTTKAVVSQLNATGMYLGDFNGFSRYSIAFNSAAGASTTLVRIFGNTGGAEATLQTIIWGAQLETGSVATSYIQTVSTTQTRNADVISVSSVSGLIGQTQGTLYAECSLNTLITNARIFTISNGTLDNLIELRINTSSRIRAFVNQAGSIQADINTTTQTAGIYKIALAYSLNDIVLYVNGQLIGTDVSALIPSCNKINIGSGATDSNFLNDRIRAAALYSSRLSNAELETLTTL